MLYERTALLVAMVNEIKALEKRYPTPKRTSVVEGCYELVAKRAEGRRLYTKLLRERAFEGLSSDGHIVIPDDGKVKVVAPTTGAASHG